jgi:hypothetical protein
MSRSPRLKLYERALKKRRFGLASLLIKAGPSAQNWLLPTVQFGTEKLLKKVLAQSGLDPNGFIGQKRLKLINFAILNRDEELFHFLIEQRVDTQTADRNDLTPLQAAQMVEEKGFEKVLAPFRESDNPTHVLKVLESLVINENMFYSELHELLK